MASPNGIGLIMRLRPSIEVISGMNECASFFQWTRSVVSSLRSRRSGTHEQDHQNDALHSQSGQSGPQQQDNQDDVLHSPSGHDGSQVQDLPNNAFPMQRGRNGLHEQDHQDDILLHLQSGLQHLRDTLPLMYNLIDRAEWRSHEQVVTNLLPNLKDAVSDADDLLDEFKWYEMKVELEGNASKSPFIDFFDKVIQGSFNKLKNIQGRLDHLSSKMQNIGLWEVAPRFDNIVRPETSSLPNEAKLFGRDKEMKDLMRLLNVPTGSKRKRGTCLVNESTCASSSTQINNESRIPSLSVLPILGIGGVGKTTLAQHICSHKQVKSHFDLIIWICVSDDFDVKRLTKEAIESCSGTEAKVDNLNCLQLALAEHVRNKRFLIVLDDMWDDALKENGQSWRNFVAPLESAKEGSMMLVTTRCPRVAHQVGTMDSITLEGLKDDIFWNFFKLCAFGSEGANNYPELENIGRNILPKLKGSPLAAKTLGRMLRMNLQESHWNSILESELWELTQEVTDILPALRLSYMYLPFYLKQCFSFCAVYPKDYRFEKEDLVEIWVSEGFVEPQGNYPIQKIGNQYFEDLVARSFFQRVRGGYVIHDLLHDMAQKVSEHDCFILRDKDDFDKVPLHVRHIYILPNSDVLHSDLMKLGKHTKLRTLICKKQLLGDNTGSVLEGWCMKLLRIRVISCASTKKLPDSIGNLTHLRYLKIEGGCSLNIPSSFCGLYNMKVFCVKKCKIQSLPSDFSKLINLQRFKSQGFSYYPGCRITLDGADMQGQQIGLIKNLNQFRGHLDIANIDMLSKDQAVEAKLKNKTYLYELMLKWPFRSSPNNNGSEIMQQNGTEVLQALQPPISLRSLLIHRYPGVSLPSWFQPENLPNLTSLDFEFCHVLDNIPFSIGVFQSLTDLNIGQCDNLSSLEHLLHPDYVPAIKKLKVLCCKSLVSVATERFGDLAFLEELDVHGCPNICSQSLVSSSLTRLKLGDCGNLLDNINCCSLTNFSISPKSVTSIQPQMWSLPALEELIFWGCNSLTSIGVPHNFSLCEGTGSVGALSMLKFLIIKYCPELLIFDSLLTKEYLPAIERIHVQDCAELLSLPGERFGGFHSLRELSISGCPRLDWQIGLVLPSPLQTLCLSYCGALSGCVFGCLENPTFLVSLKWLSVLDCPSLNWQKGLVLPSSLQTLKLVRCGDFSACVPGCLENLTSLVSLEMSGCQGVTYIPGSIWRGKLALLEELEIQDCPNLVSVGGASAVAQINKVEISHCPKLKEAEQIMMRGSRRSSRRH